MKSIRFRNSWFVRAGLAIFAISAVPLTVLVAVGFTTGKEFEAGPTGILFLCGVVIGLCSVVLGGTGVLVQRHERRAICEHNVVDERGSNN
jgi:hypothetical protein